MTDTSDATIARADASKPTRVPTHAADAITTDYCHTLLQVPRMNRIDRNRPSEPCVVYASHRIGTGRYRIIGSGNGPVLNVLEVTAIDPVELRSDMWDADAKRGSPEASMTRDEQETRCSGEPWLVGWCH